MMSLMIFGIYLTGCVLCVYAGKHSEYLHPKDPVQLVGDEISFECRSPQNYTGLVFKTVKFAVKHDEKEIFKEEDANFTRHDYSIKMFRLAKLSQKDAGVYTCIITPSESEKSVSVDIVLYVVEAEDETALVEKGKTANISCLKSDYEKENLVIFWKVDGKLKDSEESDSALIIESITNEYAFKNISCFVISRSALNFYKNMSIALQKGAMIEASRDLSVVDIITDQCKNLTACVLEARVYGNTAVNISWQVASDVLQPVPTRKGDMTVSKTSVMNINKTSPLEVYVNGIGFNIWKSTPDSPVKPKSKSNAGAIIGVLGGVIVILALVAGILFWRHRKQRTRENGNGGNTPDEMPLNTTADNNETLCNEVNTPEAVPLDTTADHNDTLCMNGST